MIRRYLCSGTRLLKNTVRLVTVLLQHILYVRHNESGAAKSVYGIYLQNFHNPFANNLSVPPRLFRLQFSLKQKFQFAVCTCIQHIGKQRSAYAEIHDRLILAAFLIIHNKRHSSGTTHKIIGADAKRFSNHSRKALDTKPDSHTVQKRLQPVCLILRQFGHILLGENAEKQNTRLDNISRP